MLSVLRLSAPKGANRRFKGTGILMLNMGGPSDLAEVGPFLHRLFNDRDIMQLPFQSRLGPWIANRRTPAICSKYAEIGGGSPILRWTEKQGSLMCKELDTISPKTAPHRHFTAFRYARPLTEEALDALEQSGVSRAVAFSQYPQYSCATTGSSITALASYYKSLGTSKIPHWTFLDRWGTDRHLVKCIADRVKVQLDSYSETERGQVVILFSAHSLPMKQVVKGDPYPTEVAGTVQLVMEELGWSNPYRLVWQSKVGPLPWLSPNTEEAIKMMGRKKIRNVLLVPIAFVNEHIETLHEMDIEYAQDVAKEVGVRVKRAESPNDHPLFIRSIAGLVKDHLEGMTRVSPQLLMTCPMCTRDACRSTKQWLSTFARNESQKDNGVGSGGIAFEQKA